MFMHAINDLLTVICLNSDRNGARVLRSSGFTSRYFEQVPWEKRECLGARCSTGRAGPHRRAGWDSAVHPSRAVWRREWQ